MNSSDIPAPDMDTLKRAWQAAVATPPGSGRLDQLTQATHDRLRRYQRSARARRGFGSTAFGLTLLVLVVFLAMPGIWLGMRVAMALWAASLIACAIGLWWARSATTAATPEAVSLAGHLRLGMRQVRREIAYHRALRWLYWLPFSVGLLAALGGRISSRPDMSWLLLGVSLVACGWGFVHGPRHWPRRLQPELDALEQLLRDIEPAHDPDAAPRAG